MISIVIPLYNKKNTIARCIDSVLCQTFRDFELVVVNDGSSDGGDDIVRGYDDSRIVIVDQINSGVSAARNRGVDFSLYPLVAFLDADDWWLDNHLDSLWSLYYECPGCVIYSSGHKRLLNGKSFGVFGLSVPRGIVEDPILKFCYDSLVNSSKCLIVKKYFIQAGGFPAGVRVGEDIYLWCRLLQKGKLAVTSRISVVVCIDADPVRDLREIEIPYPLIYYGSPDKVSDLNSIVGLKKYLGVLGLKHVAASCSYGCYHAAVGRLRKLWLVNKLYAFYSCVFFIMPGFLIRFVRKIKSLSV